MTGNDGFNAQPVSKQLMIVMFVVAAILLVPLVAMQFTSEVNWDIFDFAVMGILLLGTGTAFVVGARMFTATKARVILGIVLGLTLFLVWAELAVGVFGTPFAGS
ncbi:hypothetical protein C7C56_027220 [Massilia glaciei]|uniref:Uncharacterized protein n=2 Tax=Massilia glaciei TaxID=1524097 RepID=A0A2U2H928_9BURK|nr:hypothetical protein C7C56_027220 [Massilia glaciei]